MNFLRMAVVAVLGLLASCSTIDYTRRVEGWPELRVEIRRVTPEEVRAACAKYSPWHEIPLACTEFYFAKGVARIWISGDEQWILDHEMGHVQGYDHPNSDVMQKMYDQWKSRS